MTFVACQKDNEELADDVMIQEIAFAENAQSIEPAELPLTVKEYIDDYFLTLLWKKPLKCPTEDTNAVLATEMWLSSTATEGRSCFVAHSVPTVLSAPMAHGPCHHGLNWGELVDVADLPTAITDYITENYPDSEIRRAKLRDDNYIVLVEGPVIIVFDADGTFIEERTPLFHCLRHCMRIEQQDLSKSSLVTLLKIIPMQNSR